MTSCSINTIFTNCGLTDDGDVWWEGMTEESPDHLIDWKGNDRTPDTETPSAQPNARFTVPALSALRLNPVWEALNELRISAFIFGGKRMNDVPLMYQDFNWTHGVSLGATMCSELTAAA